MKHVSYAEGVEYAESPQTLAVDVDGDVAYIRFRRSIAEHAGVDADARLTFTATEYVISCPNAPGLRERIEQNADVWFEAAYELARAELAAKARKKRDTLLTACDYIVLPDYPIVDTDKATWEAYRQALRDVPEQGGFPFMVNWPTRPGEQ